MNFETLIRYKSMDQVYSLGNRRLVDTLMQDPAMREQLGTRKIQFDATPDLHAKLDEVVGLLQMSKREFLQSAIADAVEKAKTIISQEEVIETMEEAQAQQEKTTC